MGEDYSSGSDDGQFDKTRSSLTRKLWLSYTDLLASSLRTYPADKCQPSQLTTTYDTWLYLS